MPNVLNASFYKHGPTHGLRRAVVRQKYSAHTLAFLDFDFVKKAQYVMPPENSPVAVQWGRSPLNTSVFYGYVNHYETVSDRNSSKAMTRLVAIGTSRPMNSAIPSNWTGATRSGIAREIGKRHKLRTIIHEHPYVLDSWATGTRSDFVALQDLADEAGYRLWVDGSTLFFLDPERLLLSPQSRDVPRVFNENVHRIKVTGGSNAPRETESARRQVVYGLDYRTNEFFQATGGDPSLPTEVVYSSANTFDQAADITSASERRRADYYYLDGVVEGSARLFPGAVVLFQDSPRYTDQGGLWVVNSALHEISPQAFTTTLEASRGADQRPVAKTATTIRGTQQFAPAVVRDGSNWEATLQEHLNA